MEKGVKCYDCNVWMDEVERDINLVEDGIDWVCYECPSCGAIVYEEEHTY